MRILLITIKYSALILLMHVLFLEQILSQDEIWGVVDQEWLETEVYDKDPAANAIVLFDVAEFYLDGNLRLVREHHRRLKIINPGGYDYADIDLTFFSRQRAEEIRNLEAQTINLNENGNQIIIPVEDFFEDKLDDNFTSIKFTFPALQPGSIIEFRYRMIFDNLSNIDDWLIQEDIPVVYAKMITHFPGELLYEVFIRGEYEPVQATRGEQYDRSRTSVFRSHFSTPSGSVMYGETRTWEFEHIPAFEALPFIPNQFDYIQRAEFRLTGFRDIDNVYNFQRTWPEIAKIMHEIIDNNIRSNRTMRNKVEELTENAIDDVDKMILLYDYVRDNYQWNEFSSVFPSDYTRRFFNEERGSSADINALYIALLREADIKAYPFAVRTRESGLLNELFPRFNQFNYLLAAIEYEDGYILVDATEKNLPFAVLPERAMNERGILLDDDDDNDTLFIDVVPAIIGNITSSALVHISESGGLNMQAQFQIEGYSAYEIREYVKNHDINEYVQNYILTELPGSALSDISISGIDNLEEPVSLLFNVENDDYITFTGDMMFFSPILINRILSNPFTVDDRELPVHFGYGMAMTNRITYMLPDGWTIEELPEEMALQFNEQNGYRQIFQSQGQALQSMSQYVRRQYLFQKEEYYELRNFFEEVNRLQNQEVVMNKNNDF